MSATQIEELEASIRELEAGLASAPEEMRSMVLDQIRALQQARDSLARAQPQMVAMKWNRAPVAPELVSFFAPEPSVHIATWIPNSVRKSDITEMWMRCPHGARVYWLDDSVGCAIPPPLGGIPIRHGLDLGFWAAGTLRSQRFYENGSLRWAIEYHATGGRASAGHYVGNEPKVYLEHGLHTRWAPNGTIISQAWYDNGRLHGWSKSWEEDGYPVAATRYDEGRSGETVLPDGRRLPS